MAYDNFRINKNWWHDETDTKDHPLFNCYPKQQILEENPITYQLLRRLNDHAISATYQELLTNDIVDFSERNLRKDYPKFLHHAKEQCLELRAIYLDLVCKSEDQILALVDNVKDICEYIYVNKEGDVVKSEAFKKYDRIPVTINISEKRASSVTSEFRPSESDKPCHCSQSDDLFWIEGSNVWSELGFHDVSCEPEILENFDDDCYFIYIVTKEYGQISAEASSMFVVPDKSIEGYPLKMTDDNDKLVKTFWEKVLAAFENNS
jgi:hypothetical protein